MEAVVRCNRGSFALTQERKVPLPENAIRERWFGENLHGELWDAGSCEGIPIPLTGDVSRCMADLMNSQGRYLNSGGVLARIWGGDAKPLTMLSGLGHLLVIFMLVLTPTYEIGSDQGGTGNGVMVRLIEREEMVPLEENPGSKDSSASIAALARRSPLVEEERQHREDVSSRQLLEQSPLGLHELPAVSSAGDNERLSKREPTKDKEEDSSSDFEKTDIQFTATPDAFRDTVLLESPLNHDSLDSAPSAASPERRTGGAASVVGNEYRNKIFSAISEAAYYPKKALQEKINGETVVSFTVHKNGSLLSVSICKPSGYEILDKAAITIVKKASQKFPSIPAEVLSESLSYEVPIIFKKRS